MSPIQPPGDDRNGSSSSLAVDFDGVSDASCFGWWRRSYDRWRRARDLVRSVSAIEFLVAEVRIWNALVPGATLPLGVLARGSWAGRGAVPFVPSVVAVIVSIAFPNLHDAFSSGTFVLIRFTLEVLARSAVAFVARVSAIGSRVAKTLSVDALTIAASELGTRAR